MAKKQTNKKKHAGLFPYVLQSLYLLSFNTDGTPVRIGQNARAPWAGGNQESAVKTEGEWLKMKNGIQ